MGKEFKTEAYQLGWASINKIYKVELLCTENISIFIDKQIYVCPTKWKIHEKVILDRADIHLSYSNIYLYVKEIYVSYCAYNSKTTGLILI